jgi:hypothetical protein
MNSDDEVVDLLKGIRERLDLLFLVVATKGSDIDETIALLRGRGLDWESVGLITGMSANAARLRGRRRK